MFSTNEIAIATITLYRSISEVRAGLTLKTITEAAKYEYPVVVVDGGSVSAFHQQVHLRGGILLTQSSSNPGAARKQAMAEAAKLVGSGGCVVWMEPEKWPLVSELRKIAEPILAGEADFVLPQRSSEAFKSYPLEQQYAELFGNSFFSALIGRQTDNWFGPMAMNWESLHYFLEYDDAYGGKWDGLSVPRLRLIAKGLRVAFVEVDYTHPKEQFFEESGNVSFMMKRLEQLHNLLPALYQEAKKLGLIRF